MINPYSVVLRTSLALTSLTLPLTLSLYAQSRQPTVPDDTILARVEQILRAEPAFTGMSITPSVTHGTVTLDGTVNNQAAKVLASRESGEVHGVKTILNNLEVVDTSRQPTPARAAVPSSTQISGKVDGRKSVQISTGTILLVRVSDEINTKTAKAGDPFHGTAASTVVGNGYILIPVGTPVTGRIVNAKAAGHFTGMAELTLELVSVDLNSPGMQPITIVTQPLSSQAAGRGANTAEKTGGGAALGAIVGAVAGGGTGAGIGALSGGALGAGTNAVTRGKEIIIKPEQVLQFRTSAPAQTTVVIRDGHQVPSMPARTLPQDSSTNPSFQ